MRNKKRLSSLLLILVFIFVFFVVKNNLHKILPQKSKKVFTTLKKNEIKEIDIETNDKKIKIDKKNDFWIIKKEGVVFNADKERIEKIIDAFINLEKEEIASTNQKNFKNLGIDKQKITLITNKKKYTVYIGNSPSLEKNYLKVNNENEVFIASGFSNLLYPDDFRDLNLYLISDENKVNHLTIKIHPQTEFSLTKKNDNWFIGDKKAKKERVDYFINDLKTLKANDILPNNTPLPTFFPELTIVIKENNQEKTAYFLKKDENNYYLQIKENKQIYQVAAVYVSSFKKEEKDFFE
ncbi:MAG: DUF4340 domain-containing protein [Microgenomates group bacterium]